MRKSQIPPSNDKLLADAPDPLPDMPTVILDVSQFQECFEKESDFINFVKVVQRMIENLTKKLREYPDSPVKVKME